MGDVIPNSVIPAYAGMTGWHWRYIS